MESKVLNTILERYIFSEGDLRNLKKHLTKYLTQQSSEKEIFTLFIKYLVKVFKDLSENLPFYFEQVLTEQEIRAFSEGKSYLDEENEEYKNLQSQLKEKDLFLEQMAQKIQQIYNRISSEK